MRTWVVAAVLLGVAACSSDNSTGPGTAPPVPANLVGTSLDGAVALIWDDNAFEADPNGFQNYRIYSTSYNLDQNACGTTWNLEGTTVAPEFIASALTNGVPLCFSVSAVSLDGVESARSATRNDTPRPDARNVVIFTRLDQPSASGFRFWDDLNGDHVVQASELGLIRNCNDASVDFSVEKDPNGFIFFAPRRPGASITYYNTSDPQHFVPDLTSIDIAPDAQEHQFVTSPLQALPGAGYVFQMPGGDGFARFGALRPQHVGQSFVIVDWSFQTDPGNPELRVVRRSGS
jgi:hypothetical protein